MADGNAAVGRRHSMRPALHRVEYLVDHIVNIAQLQLRLRVGNGDGQVARNVVAECRDHGIVVGAAPLPEQVRQPVDQPLRTRFLAVALQQRLRRPLGHAVGAVCIASRQARLNGRRQQHRAAVPAPPELREQRPRKLRVSRRKFLRVLRPVHARQMHHEIGAPAEFLQFLRRGLPCAEENFIDLQCRTRSVPAVPDRVQALRQIFTDKSVCAGDEHVHQHVPPNSFSFRKSAFISSTSSRCVLWEVYCSNLPNSGFPLLK